MLNEFWEKEKKIIESYISIKRNQGSNKCLISKFIKSIIVFN